MPSSTRSASSRVAPPRRPPLLSWLASTLLFAPSLHAASLSYTRTANLLALQFLSQDETDADAFAEKSGFNKDPHLVKAFTLAVEVGTELKKTLPVDSVAFKLLLAENTGAPTDEGQAPSPTPKPKPVDSKTRGLTEDAEALLVGAETLRGASRTAVLSAAFEHAITLPGYKVGDRICDYDETTGQGWNTAITLLQDGHSIDLLQSKAKEKAGQPKAGNVGPIGVNEVTKDLGLSYTEDTRGRFIGVLIAEGREVISQRKVAAAAAAEAAEKAKKVADAKKAAADKPTEKAEPAPAEKAAPPISPDGKLADTVLRNVGLSFGAGAGIVLGKGSDEPIEIAILRWNIFQRSATLRWNYEVTRGNRKGDQVGFGIASLRGRPLVEDRLGPNATSKEIMDLFNKTRWIPTSFGPFIGSGLGGNTVNFGTKEDGQPRNERPYIAGLQAGWLFYSEASSLIYLDVGATFSPTTGFSHSRPYIGVSADGIVLLKLIDGMRNFIPGGAE